MTYTVHASEPTVTIGVGTLDSRQIGPFISRQLAEEAAIHLADDPCRYACIKIVLHPRPMVPGCTRYA